MNDLYLEIAGCIIKISFLPLKKSNLHHDNKRQRKLFVRDLKKYLHNFILTIKPENIHYTIFVEGQHISFIDNSKLDMVSIPLFKKVSKYSMQTYDYINILQFQMILRDIVSRLLIERSGCVIHASAVSVHDTAHIFLGESTAGKSTIVRLLKEAYQPLADDLVFIRKEGKKYFLYQTPFIEKQWWIRKENKKYEVSHVFFIHKEKQTIIENIAETMDILPLWLNQILIAKENKEEILKWSIAFIKSGISFHNLHFRKNKKEIMDTIGRDLG